MQRVLSSSYRNDSLYAMTFGWRSLDSSCASRKASLCSFILCTGMRFTTYGRRSATCVTRCTVP